MSTQSKKTNQAALVTALGVADQLLLTDANTGQVKRIEVRNVNLTNLSGMETPGNVLSLKEFTTKYVVGKGVGHILTDRVHQNATAWYLEVKDGILLNLQSYVVFVAKAVGGLSSPWNHIALVVFPINPTTASRVYIVNQQTYASANDYALKIFAIPLTEV